MRDAVTVTVTIAGLFFSLTCALLLEELLFGGLFRLLKPVQRKAQGRAKEKEEELYANRIKENTKC